MYGFVHARIACHEDAEEVAQDVMIRIYEHLDERIQYPASWVRKIARNAVYDYYRKRARHADVCVPLHYFHDADDLDDDEWLSRMARDAGEARDLPAPNSGLFNDIIDSLREAFATTHEPELKMRVVELAAERLSTGDIGAEVGKDDRYVTNTMNRLRKNVEPRHPEWAKDRELRGPRRGTPHGLPGDAAPDEEREADPLPHDGDTSPGDGDDGEDSGDGDDGDNSPDN